MPLTGFSPVQEIAGARGSMTQLFNAQLVIDDTQYIGFEDTVVVQSQVAQTILVQDSGRLIIGGNPRGAWDSTVAYNRYDAVTFENRIWVWDVSGTNGGTSTVGQTPLQQGSWFRYAMDTRPCLLRVISNAATNAQRQINAGAASPAALALCVEDGGTIQAFNASIELNGAFGSTGAASNTEQSTIQIDEITFRANNARNPITLRPAINTGATEPFGLTPASFVGDITLESSSLSGSAVYISEWINGGATPQSVANNSGYFIGHGSNPQSAEVYTIPNYAGESNTFVSFNHKNDMQVASHGSITSVNDLRLYEFRNSTGGLWREDHTDGVGFAHRPLTSAAQRSGAGIVTSTAFFVISDDSENVVEDATVLVMSSNEESITRDGATQAINYDISSDLSDTDFPRLPDIAADAANNNVFGTQAENTWRLSTDENGATESQLFHLGYWFFADQAAFTATGTLTQAERRQLGEASFERTGNNPNVLIAAYGYDILETTVDMTGAGEKEFPIELIANTFVVGENAPTTVTFDDDNGNYTLTGDSTGNDLFDAIHADHIAKSTVPDLGQTDFNYGFVEGDFIDGNGAAIRISGAGRTITVSDGDRYQGITNAQLTFVNGDNINLVGGEYTSTVTPGNGILSQVDLGSMTNCIMNAQTAQRVRIANGIRNSTINGTTVLADGLTDDDVVGVTFNGPIIEWPIPEATGHTYGGVFDLVLNQPGVWTRNTFNAGAQLNIQPNQVNNVTRTPTTAERLRSDVAIPADGRVVDLTQWDNEGTLLLGGTQTWYALITPQQLTDGDFSVADGSGAIIATIYPNNQVDLFNDSVFRIQYVVRTGPAGTHPSDLTDIGIAGDLNANTDTIFSISRADLVGATNIYRVFACGRGILDYDSGELTYDQLQTTALALRPGIDQLANTTQAVNTSLDGDYSGRIAPHTTYRVQLPAGTSIYNSAPVAQADILNVKSIDSDYLAFVRDNHTGGANFGLRARANDGVLFYHEAGDGDPNTPDATVGIEIVPGSSAANVPLAQAAFALVDPATGLVTSTTILASDVAGFRSNVVEPLTGSTTFDGVNRAAEVTVDGVDSNVVDYPRITNAVDNSQTAVVVDDIANGVGYTVSGGSKGLLGRTYDSGEDYTDEL